MEACLTVLGPLGVKVQTTPVQVLGAQGPKFVRAQAGKDWRQKANGQPTEGSRPVEFAGRGSRDSHIGR